MKASDNKTLEETNDLLRKILRTKRIPYRFISGLVYGLGATVGVAIIITLSGYLIARLEPIPIIGEWVGSLLNESAKNINNQPFQEILEQ